MFKASLLIVAAALAVVLPALQTPAVAESADQLDCSALQRQPDGSYLVTKNISIVVPPDSSFAFGEGAVIGANIPLNDGLLRDFIAKKCAASTQPTSAAQSAGAPTPPPLPAPVPPQPQFFYDDGGKPAGPVDLAGLQAKVAAGAIGPATLVWRSGTPNWVAAKDLAELSSSFGKAMPCDAEPGNVLYDDKFADTAGGWGDSSANIKSGEFLIHLSPPEIGWSSAQNVSFHPADGNYCLDVILPQATPAGVIQSAGLELLGTDHTNFYLAMISSNGHVGFYRKQAGTFSMLFGVDKSPAVNLQQGATNSIRVVAKAGALSVLVNDSPITEQQVQVPSGTPTFGFYAQVDGSPSTKDIVVRVEDYKVTSTQ